MSTCLRPLPDETAGSILFRLAHSELRSVSDLAMHMFGLSYHQAHADLDRLLPAKRMAKLANECRLQLSTAQQLRLPDKWISSAWSPEDRRYVGPTKLCCECLRKYRYGRRFWRTCFAAACPEHGCELIDECPHRPLWEVARATSAAPTYFSAFRASGNELFVDGGLVANNPSLIAHFEVALNFAAHMDTFKVLNIGTEGGECSLPKFTLRSGGLLLWAKKAPETLMQAQAVSTEALMARLLLRLA